MQDIYRISYLLLINITFGVCRIIGLKMTLSIYDQYMTYMTFENKNAIAKVTFIDITLEKISQWNLPVVTIKRLRRS